MLGEVTNGEMTQGWESESSHKEPLLAISGKQPEQRETNTSVHSNLFSSFSFSLTSFSLNNNQVPPFPLICMPRPANYRAFFGPR